MTIAAAGIALLAAGAGAATTVINTPPADEDSHQQILQHLYGGTFTAVGLSYTNNTVTAERVDDALDQVFEPGTVDLSAHA